MTTLRTRPHRDLKDPVRMIDRVWSTRWIPLVTTAALVLTFAELAAEFTPRGPVTSAQALVTMGVALVVGLVVGVLLPSRWLLLAGPILFTGMFELSRMHYVGASIDAPSFGSTLEIIGVAVDRLFPMVVTLLPLVAGTALGITLAVRAGHPNATPLGRWQWAMTILGLLLLAALAFLMIRPATTAPILGDGWLPLEGSVAELTKVDINGQQQSLMIRGRSEDNPVLLYLAGGPGGTDLGAMRRDVGLEQDFVVVTWDQRGTGRSYPALDPTETLTVAQMVDDTVAVTEYLADRFDEERIYLVGQSWGSGLGVLAAQARPDLYHAFVGVGQMVAFQDTDVMFWEDALAWAEDSGDTSLAARLRGNGPPPYSDIRMYGPVTSTEHQWNPYPGFDPNNEMPAILFVPEYSLIDRINAFRGFFDVVTVLYPQLQEIDFRAEVSSLEIPYYMVLGEHEARGRVLPANEWFEMLDAPVKDRIVFEDSGHRANFDRPAEFAELMRRVASES